MNIIYSMLTCKHLLVRLDFLVHILKECNMLSWSYKYLTIKFSRLLHKWLFIHTFESWNFLCCPKAHNDCCCRFIFCRATHSLFKPTNHKAEFLPSCMPPLPESVDAESMLSQSCMMRVASFFNAANQFSFAELTTWPDAETEEAGVKGVPVTDGDLGMTHSSTSSFWWTAGPAHSCSVIFCSSLMQTRIVLASPHSCLVPHIK